MKATGSAFDHHRTKADHAHVLLNFIARKTDYRPGIDLYIGPDTHGRMTEILIDNTGPEPVLFHCDDLREHFYKFLPKV